MVTTVSYTHLEIKHIYEEMLNLADIVFAGYKDATLLLHKQVDQSLPYDKQLRNILMQMCQDYHIEFIFGTIRKDEELTGYMVTSTKMVTVSYTHLDVYKRQQ